MANVYYNVREGKYSNKLPYFTRKENRQGWEEYYKETSRLMEIFHADLREEYGTVGNPKEELLFSKAWDLGHSSGLSEVALYYAELVELIR